MSVAIETVQRKIETQPRLVASITTDPDEIYAAMKLRYNVFSIEQGAELHSLEQGIDKDIYDDVAEHLIVKDAATTQIIAYTRIITSDGAAKVGGFYSQSEFNLENVLKCEGRIMEIGRTVVHANYRDGSAIGVLWTGIAKYLMSNQMDYLMGCASLPFTHNEQDIHGILDKIYSKYLADESLRVTPYHQLPKQEQTTNREDNKLPPLLKAYLRLGAKVCGEACWDKDFGVADVFIWLERDKINPRYARHFLHN